jgi:DNA replication and repair protein RecF
MPRLALTELTLSHFRSHRTARLALDGRPIAIYGPNGAGKTNILEAVSLFSPGRGLRRAAADEMARQPEKLGWKLTGLLESLHNTHELATWAEPGGARQVTIDDKTTTQTALGRVARMVWLVPSMDRLWIEGADGRRRFLDRITLSFDPAHAENTLAYEKAMRERNRLLKDQVRDAHWYVALEAQMAKSGAAIHRSRSNALALIKQAQEQSETSFPAAEMTLIHPDPTCETPDSEDALRATFASGRQKDLYAGRTLSGPHRADIEAIYTAKGIEAKQCSTGEQKALLISLILSNARALAQDFGAPPILLLDEVAAHLDATRRAALYDEICALNAQAWMTGTGAELFNDLGARSQYVHISDHEGLSRIDVTT